MRNLFLLASVAALGIATPVLAQQGKGGDGPPGKGGGERAGLPSKGGDRGGPPQARGNDRGASAQAKGNDRERANRGNDRRGGGEQRAEQRAERGRDDARGKGNDGRDRAERRGNDRGPDFARKRSGPEYVRVTDDRGKGDRAKGRDAAPKGKRAWEGDNRVRVVDARRGTGIRWSRGDSDWTPLRRYDRGRYVYAGPTYIQGCPPGLARQNNGCLPPGQARRIADLRGGAYDNWSGYRGWQGDDRYDWRYDNGYAYGVDRSSNLIATFLPLLGGALFTGNQWPTSYDNYDVPQYYDNYYGYDDRYDYRYADGAIFAVDPQTQGIQGIAGLLTGDDWGIGQTMPSGYDFYNVPPEYRDRYADRDDAMYRYSDGYVYEVDPTTRLIQQAIELIA